MHRIDALNHRAKASAATLLVVLLLVGCGEKGKEMTPATGEQVFQLCLNCHSAQAQNRPTGPNLHGIFGRTAATREGFFYSEALKKSGIVWDDNSLDAFLSNPTAAVPGTYMLISVPDPARRTALMQYLHQLN